MLRFVTLILLLLTTQVTTTCAATRPNILLIVTDDQSPLTLSCYGNAVCQTQNLTELAATGMVLDQAYHMGSMSGAVCSPSRTMIMSGRTLWHLPPRSKKHLQREEGITDGKDILNHTIPAVFNRAGYETFRTCKVGNSYALANQLFATVHDQTSREADREHGSQWHGQKVLDFLTARSTAKEKKPFLIYLGFSHPHDPRVGRQDLLEKYGATNLTKPPAKVPPQAPPLPKNWLPEHPFPHGHPQLRDEVAVSGVLTSREEATIRNELGREYACIENIDEQIGLVLEQLKSSGELDNTYVIFTSDHGIAVGRHGLVGKQNLYEHTWRVPFLVSGPGIKAGSRAPGNAYLLDILPTICELAGIDIPDTAQGHSLKPVLMGEQESVRDVLYGCYCGGTKPGMRSVRQGDWKLIKYDTLDGKVRETQLFNLAENPQEFIDAHHAPEVIAKTGHTPKPHQTNLAKSPEHADKLAEMEALLLSEMQRLKDPYRFWDQPQRRPAARTLKEAVNGRFDIGVGVGFRALQQPANQSLIVDHFNYITPENCMKFAAIQPQENEFRFQKSDRVVKFAQEQNLKVLGHCLVWAKDDRTPEWFFQDGDQEVKPELLLQRMKKHIKTVVERYQGRVHSWDVVNEAIGGRNDEYLRDSVWAKLLSDDFIVEAFRYTHEIDPAALLIYNDYHLHTKWRRDRMERIVRKLRQQNAPIHAIGIQGHYDLDAVPYQELEELLIRLRQLKLKIAISELDIDMIPRGVWWANGGKDRERLKNYNPYPDGCPPELLARQAEQFARLFALFQKYEDVILRVSFWNVHDGESWLNHYPWTRDNYPTLFDRARQPKPAFHAVLRSLLGDQSDVAPEPENTTQVSDSQHNILFIAVDDLRPELACYGVDGIATPNFDRLAKSGMRFERAYCQQAVCGASRLAIMGGLYPTHTREQTFHVDGWRRRHPDLVTMNQHFGRHGFKTIGLGKVYHNTSGPGVDTPHWDEWIKVRAPAYASATTQAAYKAALASDSRQKRGPATEMADVPDDKFADGQRANKAKEILQRLATTGDRFFLAVGFTKPHLPFVAPKRYWDLYEREKFTMPLNVGIPPGYPPYAANLSASELRAYTDYEGEMPTDFSDEVNQRLLHGYAACTSYVDACLGRVLNALDETGLAENTIVVLWGDHGWKLGDHSSWVKHTNFECDTRVPLLIRVPGKGRSKSTNRLVELIDLYPTLCELVDVPQPPHCQGRSFATLLDDPQAGHRYSAYSSYPAKGGMGHSIRFQKYRYTEWRPRRGGAATAAVLTDLSADPGEVTNVIDSAEHAEAREQAKRLLEKRIQQAAPRSPDRTLSK